MKKLRIPKTVVNIRKLVHQKALQKYRLHKICLTGGPCGGKTMGNFRFLNNDFSTVIFEEKTLRNWF